MSNIYKFYNYKIFKDLLDAISYRFNKHHKISSDNILLLLITYHGISKSNFYKRSEKNKLVFINKYALDTIPKLLQINIIIRDSNLHYFYYSNDIMANNIYLLEVSLNCIYDLYYLDEHDNVCYNGMIISNDNISIDHDSNDNISIDHDSNDNISVDHDSNDNISVDHDSNVIYDNDGNLIFNEEEYNDLVLMIS